MAQRDYDGLRRLVKRGLAISCGFALLCFLAVLLVSDELAVLFGATDPATIRLTGQGLPLITTMNFSLSVILPLTIVYQINDHSVISALSASSLLLGMGIGFIYEKYMTGSIWVAFPIGSVLSIAFMLLCAIIVKRRAGGNVGSIHLIPAPLDDTTRFDISVSCDRSGVGEAVRKACDFLSGKTTHDNIQHISHCMEELLLNYVEHSGKSQKAYMDISILCDQDEITLTIKDDGIPFDPIHAANEEVKAGLKLVQAFMSDASYNYTLGQNIVIMKWGGMIK